MPVKRLQRKNKVLFGVCGGLGDYFDIDPVIIRLAFVIAVVYYGAGVLLYAIMVLVIPKEEETY